MSRARQALIKNAELHEADSASASLAHAVFSSVVNFEPRGQLDPPGPYSIIETVTISRRVTCVVRFI